MSNTRICLQLSQELYEKLKNIATANNLSTTALINLVLNSFILNDTSRICLR